MNISDILARRADNAVVTISPDATVRELVETLANHNIGACVVSSDGTAIDGIVSERDVVRRLSDTEDLANLPVSQIMTSSVLTCAPATGLDELMGLMTERRFRHVPVVEDGTMVGIVSLGDAVKHRIDELTFERDQLATYVNS